MKQKVYCKDCKYLNEGIIFIDCICPNLTLQDTWYDKDDFVPISPAERNKDNDCKDWVKK